MQPSSGLGVKTLEGGVSSSLGCQEDELKYEDIYESAHLCQNKIPPTGVIDGLVSCLMNEPSFAIALTGPIPQVLINELGAYL